MWNDGGTIEPQNSMRAGVFAIPAISIAFFIAETVRLMSTKMSTLQHRPHTNCGGRWKCCWTVVVAAAREHNSCSQGHNKEGDSL
ncbi:hypothetical protein J6590_000829 [Homalodisca vitripennis]|nr:hypothetical protein J6590_000829 [Homalodisca vitripennis]